MAVIDPRLLPLIEALAASGADWLAFELFDGLRVGRVQEDSDEQVNEARQAVGGEFRNEQRLPVELHLRTQTGTPIVEDEQIDWAARYVADRISDSIRMLEASLNHKRSRFTKGLKEGLSGIPQIEMLEIVIDDSLRYIASSVDSRGILHEDNYPVSRGSVVRIDDYTALVWVHGVTTAVSDNRRYYQGKRRIPAPLTVRRHCGQSDIKQLATEILGLSKMSWNTFDLYTKLPAVFLDHAPIKPLILLVRLQCPHLVMVAPEQKVAPARLWELLGHAHVILQGSPRLFPYLVRFGPELPYAEFFLPYQ